MSALIAILTVLGIASLAVMIYDVFRRRPKPRRKASITINGTTYYGRRSVEVREDGRVVIDGKEVSS